MTRKLGVLAFALVWCFGASAAINPAVIAGTVRDNVGVPQMGALVEILANSAPRTQTVLTDTKGAFTIAGLLPGLYTIKVTAPSFLPTIRERVHLQSGANLLINLTLNTLFEAIQLVPRYKATTNNDDDWRWALRSMANRPILRLADDKPLVVVQRGESADGELKARVSFISGSDGDAFSAPSTNFQVEQSVSGKGRTSPAKWSLNGEVGNAPSNPNAAIRAAYSREMPNGSYPEIAISAKHFASLNPDQPAIQALALSIANSMTFGEYLELDYGNETQTIQFMDRATSFRPFATISAHPGKNTILQYRYATATPDLRRAKGFDIAPTDLSESSSNPRITITPQGQHIERASHHELSVSQRLGAHKVQLALFSDSIHNAALPGTGASFTQDPDALIGDPYSGNFAYNGGHIHTQGVRAVYSHPLAMGLDATLNYGYGGVLTAPESLVSVSQTSTSLITTKRHSAAAKLSGTAPRSKTKVIASYRWLSGSGLTSVDMFNASAGQTDPFLSFFLRQPIPTMHLLPSGFEALIDVRNLLAQGYRPVLSADGSTVYLVQGTRSIRAGLSFNF